MKIYPEIIKSIVHDFYEKAVQDEFIGYKFRVIENFETHLPKIVAFWEFQINGTKSELLYEMKLLYVHMLLEIKIGELGRWLVLFKQSMDKFISNEEQKRIWYEKLHFFEDVFKKRLINIS